MSATPTSCTPGTFSAARTSELPWPPAPTRAMPSRSPPAVGWQPFGAASSASTWVARPASAAVPAASFRNARRDLESSMASSETIDTTPARGSRGLALQQRLELLRQQRPAEVITLAEAAAQRAHAVPLLARLDAFGDHVALQLLRQLDDAAHQRRGAA